MIAMMILMRMSKNNVLANVVNLFDAIIFRDMSVYIVIILKKIQYIPRICFDGDFG
ncbi:hypothetical protein HanXRQr2_Chr04g0146131 [Helianthus annuus]|uniref:Uncharacterized protein n=1 Tax=Helianthus annuus TaxID=4232 RepID=A0A9K3NPZ7_HELAN|nr:hypothetical protein HanXRQr2_Chr04g0146131 [Helianthus annuus]